jgi:hypothetical protein
MWAQPDFWPFINRSYSSNPWPLRGKNQFWPGEPINATIGIAPGFEAYEWRRNGTLITNAISNQIQVTGIGVYDARVKRDGVWSDWSRVPVPIKGNDYRIEAEDWTAMSGVQAQITSDVDGNLNVTSINNGDWMDYAIAPYLPGTYTLKLRVAAANSGGKLQILIDNSLVKTIDVPRTFGNQTWQTVTTTLPLSAGQKTIRIRSNATTTFNFNWMEFSMAVESPLPVKFVYFNASCENAGGVALRWRTAMELNTNKFSVERSTDGAHWIEVGSVAAAGQSSQERSYVFSDKTPASDNFYRIVEYDFDGKVTVSSIVRSSCASRTEITLYPNPNSGRSTLNMVFKQATNVVIDIMDSKGAIIEQKKLILLEGANSVPIDLSSFAKGFYTVTVQYNGEVKSLKMIKN